MAAPLPTADDLGPRPAPQSRRALAGTGNAGAVGDALAAAGVTMTQVGSFMEDVRDESDVRALDAEHDEALRTIRDEAMQARGLAAQDARAAANLRIEEQTAGLLKRARSNRSRNMLTRIFQTRSSSERDTIGRYATGETATVMDAQFVARRDQYVRTAQESWDRPDQADAALATALGEVAARGGWRGWSPDQVASEQASVRSAVRQGIAEQMVTAGDYEGALAYVDRYRDEIDHDAERSLRATIRVPMVEDEAEAIVNNLPALTGQPTGQAPASPRAAPVNEGDQPGRFRTAGGFTVGDGYGARRPGNGTHHGMDAGAPIGTPWRVGRDFEIIESHRQQRVENGRDGGNMARVRIGETEWLAMHLPNLPRAGRYGADSNVLQSGDSGSATAANPHIHWQPANAAARAIYAQGREATAAFLTGGGAQGSRAPTGRTIDYAAARQQIEAMGLSRDVRRAALTALDRRVSAEDRVIADQTRAAEDELSRRLADIQASGGKLTRISQIDAGLMTRLRRYAPERIPLLYSTIEANNRPHEPEANSPLYAQLIDVAARDPAGFLRGDPELFRGRLPDSEIVSLHRMQATIREREGPQPSQIMSMINFVLPQTDLVPSNVGNQRQGSGSARETEAQARNRITDNLRARLFGAVQSRIMQNYRPGTRVTEQEILDAVKAETIMITIPLPRSAQQAPRQEIPSSERMGGYIGQALLGVTPLSRHYRAQQQAIRAPAGNPPPEPIRMRMFEAREIVNGQPQNFQITIPTRSLPYIDAVLRASGRPINGQERIAEYLRHKSRYDAN